MSNTKIVIADDHRVVSEGIKSALQELPEFEVVGEAGDGLQSVELAKSLRTWIFADSPSEDPQSQIVQLRIIIFDVSVLLVKH